MTIKPIRGQLLAIWIALLIWGIIFLLIGQTLSKLYLPLFGGATAIFTIWIILPIITKPNLKRICRGCGLQKDNMALEYGDAEGLCRECLNQYLPLALKDV